MQLWLQVTKFAYWFTFLNYAIPILIMVMLLLGFIPAQLKHLVPESFETYVGSALLYSLVRMVIAFGAISAIRFVGNWLLLQKSQT